MQWMEIKITFESVNNDRDETISALVADLFYDLGAKGAVVDDPHLSVTEGWADALPRAVQPALTGYLPEDERLNTSMDSLNRALDDLARSQGVHFVLTMRPVAEEDWAESWKAFFFPEKITPRMVVKPTWRDYQAQADEVILEIDPGMAFGTGTHPTTALCLRLLEQTIRAGDHVLDVGTGSGILLVAASKLGAVWLTGVDSDPVAVDVARVNLQRNGIAASTFDLHSGHLVDPVKRTYDVVVANILADVIIDLLDHVGRILKPDGVFICSGIIETRQADVISKLTASGLDLIEILTQDEWVALGARKAALGTDHI